MSDFKSNSGTEVEATQPEITPALTSRRLNVLMWSPPLLQEVDRNGETTFPRDPTIQSPSIVCLQVVLDFVSLLSNIT